MTEIIPTILTDAQTAQTLALMLVCFLTGSLVPVYFVQERFRGFGRFIVSKLPYQPPAGMNEEQAMIQATQQDIDQEAK